MTTSAVSRLWFGEGVLPRAARGALWPVALGYRAVVGARNALYDAGVLRVHGGAIPALAIGNLTVGGTGKTPVAAWFAAELVRRGARPAIILRGYGADEPLVHERLNPDVPVVVAPDRVGGLAQARALGADVAVLDDALQHRRVARVANIVLISAERGVDGARMLPAGPYREPLSALRRASLVVVTRKTASASEAAAVLARATAIAGAPGAVVHLEPSALVPVAGARGGAPVPLEGIAGRRLLVLTGVGEPGLVARQLEGAGAEVELRGFPDHHAFSDVELAEAARSAATAGAQAVCTLKDAVKIAARWPGPGPLWYVSQRLTVDQGMEQLVHVLDSTVAVIRTISQTAG